MNLKVMIAVTLIAVAQMATGRELIHVLEDEAEVVGAGTCVVNSTQFDCVKVQHEGNLYTVIGTISGDSFFAQYILKLIGDDWHVVWSFKGYT